MNHQFTSEVRVSGKGATRQQAFAAALSKATDPDTGVELNKIDPPK